jgi:hypothetical protein
MNIYSLILASILAGCVLGYAILPYIGSMLFWVVAILFSYRIGKWVWK